MALTVLLRIFSGGVRNVAVSSDYAKAVLIAESRLATAGIDDTLAPGLEGNLVVGVYFDVTVKSRKGDGRTRTIPLGVLPAIPFSTGQ